MNEDLASAAFENARAVVGQQEKDAAASTGVTGEQSVTDIEKITGCMAGMIGGIDAALVDNVGHPVPFVLVLFSGRTACHATNMGGKEGMDALRAFAQSLDQQADTP